MILNPSVSPAVVKLYEVRLILQSTEYDLLVQSTKYGVRLLVILVPRESEMQSLNRCV